MKSRRAKVWLVAAACAGMPLVTIGTCDPESGTINIYRNDYDDDRHHYYYYDDYDRYHHVHHYDYDLVDCLLFPFLCL